MVCVAAFIILCLISVVVAFLSIFKKDIGKKYWAIFKKAWYCVFKKVRLQKCDSNFKDDVKNSILKRVILKHPKWVKPLSIVIEIISILIVFITIWSIVIAIKSLLALWVFGTCNVSQPSHCGLGAEACTIDAGEPTSLVEKIGRSFGEWGQIFSAIPDRLKTWDAADYIVDQTSLLNPESSVTDGSNTALIISDPGCTICAQSYRNMLKDDFFNKYQSRLVIYPIQDGNGNYKFANSEIISRYLIATQIFSNNQDSHYVEKFISRLFTEKNTSSVMWQSVFNNEYSREQAENEIIKWLKDFGINDDGIKTIKSFKDSEQVNNILNTNKDLVENRIKAKGIPTSIYDSKKHNGLYKL